MKKIISLVLSFFIAINLVGCSKEINLKKYSASFLELFDTASSITAYDVSQKDFDYKYNQLYSFIEKYSKLFDIYNNYDGLNNLKYINDNAASSPVKTDVEIIELLKYSKDIYFLTDGYVNIAMGSVLSIWHEYRENGISNPKTASLPGENELKNASLHTNINNLVIDEKNNTVYFKDEYLKLDVGAVAKGYVCNKIKEYITDNQLWNSAVISLGGNIITVGEKTNKTPFIIGVENPNSTDYLTKIKASNGLSIVTSGSYQRYYTVNNKNYNHIINKNTLFPADYFQSVTVISNNSFLADAFSTALFCMPLQEGLKIVENNKDIEAIWLDNNNKITESSGIKALKE